MEKINNQKGFLRVQTFQGDRVLPMQGAQIKVFNNQQGQKKLVSTNKTDANGQSSLISLDARPFSLSQSPGKVQPYTTYDVEVSMPGYYTTYYVDLPIFSGTVSLQNTQMIPLPSGVSNQINYVYEQEFLSEVYNND